MTSAEVDAIEADFAKAGEMLDAFESLSQQQVNELAAIFDKWEAVAADMAKAWLKEQIASRFDFKATC